MTCSGLTWPLAAWHSRDNRGRLLYISRAGDDRLTLVFVSYLVRTSPMPRICLSVVAILLCLAPPRTLAQPFPPKYIQDNFTRSTCKIPVRDGVHLHTIVYAPKDKSQKYPMLMTRTPYGIPPYEENIH